MNKEPTEAQIGTMTLTPMRIKIILDFIEWCELPDLTRREIEEIQSISKELKAIVGL